MTEATPPQMPLWAHVHLTHAALQRIADEAGVDLLHIKGPATSTTLRAGVHHSSDVDVLVRPAHLDRFTAELETRGWGLYSGFEEGSPFGHAANYTHPSWAFADVHRQLPGPRATAEAVFDRLWAERTSTDIAHHPCPVPSLPGQVLVQTLHAARSHGVEAPDAWRLCSDEVRDQTRALADELQATTALAAAIGELDQHRDAPDHALWSYWSRPGGDRLDEWSARLLAASGPGERARLMLRALRVNRTHLELRLGRRATAADMLREQFARTRLAFTSLGKRMKRGSR